MEREGERRRRFSWWLILAGAFAGLAMLALVQWRAIEVDFAGKRFVASPGVLAWVWNSGINRLEVHTYSVSWRDREYWPVPGIVHMSKESAVFVPWWCIAPAL